MNKKKQNKKTKILLQYRQTPLSEKSGNDTRTRHTDL